MNQTFIIGDVHGCFEELQDLLTKASASLSRHRIILVGDLVNKGPKSFETLKWVYENGVEAVIGNHELRFIKGVRDDRSMSPSLKQLKSQMGSDLNGWIQWIESWPKFVEEEQFIVVHAGLVPGRRPEDTNVNLLASIRTWDGRGEQLYRLEDPAWHELYKGEKTVVYGHWALQGLKVKPNSIGLDTGCVYGRELTGVWIESRDIVSVPARETYCPVN